MVVGSTVTVDEVGTTAGAVADGRRRGMGFIMRVRWILLSMLVARSNNWWMLDNRWSSGSLSHSMMLSYRLTKATVCWGNPSAKIVKSCLGPGRKPAASIWLSEVLQIVMNSERRMPPRVGRHRSWRRRASITMTAE